MVEIATPPGDSEEVQIRLNRKTSFSFAIKKLNTNLVLSLKKKKPFHEFETVATPDLQLQTMLNIDYTATVIKLSMFIFIR